MARKKLVIKLLAGVADPERVSQAFTVASTAIASGIDVSLWLASEASWFALPGKAEEFTLPLSAPLHELRDGILAAGSITLCTQCAARRKIEEKDLIPGIKIKGSTAFVEEVTAADVQALVY
jgi:predicted peroxiredoxin